jgi:hypothetical protein
MPGIGTSAVRTSHPGNNARPAIRIDRRDGGSRLPAMSRRFPRSFLLLMVLSGCERQQKKAPPRAESARAVVSAPARPLERATVSNWDTTSFGPVLLVARESPSIAFIVTPLSSSDQVSLARSHARLVGRSGSVQDAVLDAASVAPEGTCPAVAPVHGPGTDNQLAPWSVGFVNGRIQALPMDSLEALTRTDSAALTVQATRLASTIPGDGSDRFVGLPFSVHTLWRFSLPTGVQVIAATLIRRVNEEARPLEEQTLLIGERDSGATTYTLAYSERSHGGEETIESAEILVAILAGTGPRLTPTMILERDYGEDVAYSLVQRAPPATWQLRWTSTRARCT